MMFLYLLFCIILIKVWKFGYLVFFVGINFCKTTQNSRNSLLLKYLIEQTCYSPSFYNYKGKLKSFIAKKMFIEKSGL